MKTDMAVDDRLTPDEAAAAKSRRLTAMGLQAIEQNPLTPDEAAMFEMFERERWSHARRRAYIRDLLLQQHPAAAE